MTGKRKQRYRELAALMGYEIAKGRLSASGIAEARHIDFAPRWTGNMR